MDTLEVFEHGRSLPRDQITFIPLKPVVLPIFIDKSLEEQWPPPSRSAVYFLDHDVAIKLPTQHYVPDVAVDQPEKLLLTLSHANFISQVMEKETFDLIDKSPSPCKSLVRRLHADHSRNVTFFERLTPLANTLSSASEQQRARWACEFVSAVAYLESLGLVPCNVEARDLCLDRTSRLKLVGFGTSPRRPSTEVEAQYDDTMGLHPMEKFRRDVEKSHQLVASCLHYILTGIDPDEQTRLMTNQALTELKISARKGEYPVAPRAAVIGDILRDAWALKTKVSFSDIAEKVKERLSATGDSEKYLPQQLPDTHYKTLEVRCQEWMKTQQADPRWMNKTEYEAACENVGHWV